MKLNPKKINQSESAFSRHLSKSIISTFFLISSLLLFSTTSFAHIKWFVDPNMQPPADFKPYHLTDLPVLIWIAVGLLFAGISIVLDKKIPLLAIAPTAIKVLKTPFIIILQVLTGISLIITALQGNLIAPHLTAYGALGMGLLGLEVIIGALLIINKYVNHAAALMYLLLLGVLIQYGFVSLFEYINLAGIATFLLFTKMPNDQLRAKLAPYSVDMLRIITGIAVIVLGITEKITGAVLAEAFLEKYHWNFMQLIGFNSFDNHLFVLSAGSMEIIFGVILVLGTITRINTLVLSGVLLTSNIVFFATGNSHGAIVELIGHAPIIGSALILLLCGYGEKLKITNLFSPKSAKEGDQ